MKVWGYIVSTFSFLGGLVAYLLFKSERTRRKQAEKEVRTLEDKQRRTKEQASFMQASREHYEKTDINELLYTNKLRH